MPLSMSMSIADLYRLAHNRKASNVLCTLVKRERFLDPDENCQRNLADRAGSLVTSSRPPGRPQKRPDVDDPTWNAVVTNSQRTADAANKQYLRCGCSRPSRTVVHCAADIDGPLHTACTAPAEERFKHISTLRMLCDF